MICARLRTNADLARRTGNVIVTGAAAYAWAGVCNCNCTDYVAGARNEFKHQFNQNIPEYAYENLWL